MTMLKKRDLLPERRHAALTPAKSLRIVRELQELTQAALAKASGVPQSAIAGIEAGAIALGVVRAERLARALKVHPACWLAATGRSRSRPGRCSRLVRASTPPTWRRTAGPRLIGALGAVSILTPAETALSCPSARERA